MNKTELKQFYKSELREIEIQESVLNQSLNVITNRKYKIQSALEKLGASMRTRKGKTDVLTEKQKLEMRASLTK